MKLLAISGSLRAASINTALLELAARLAPADVSVELFAGLGDLPHFNADREAEPIPSVLEWRERVRTADGLLICSPEYAHGVPGSLKNALDWLVGGVEIVDKPVALLNASPYSTHAHASLAETLRTMSARVVPEASLTLPVRGKPLPTGGLATDPAVVAGLRASLHEFVRATQTARPPQG
ncbi:MAG: NAD(P)H-dependent oxidoreductase [Opitutae bacterium]|nr:NAD(P)H-dependent oxidoreductase [Opitutae bacterium]